MIKKPGGLSHTVLRTSPLNMRRVSLWGMTASGTFLVPRKGLIDRTPRGLKSKSLRWLHRVYATTPRTHIAYGPGDEKDLRRRIIYPIGLGSTVAIGVDRLVVGGV